MSEHNSDVRKILRELQAHGNPSNVEGMARYGINSRYAYGVKIPVLRKIAKQIGKNHVLAIRLWKSRVHEARILAGMIDDPAKVTVKQADTWVKDFNSWDVCDQVCMNLFDKTPFAYEKAIEWSRRKREFEKRAGFALMACLAWHDKEAKDCKFRRFFRCIIDASADERNFVKKAVNWALRQIGKRDKILNKSAIAAAEQIQKIDSKSARWIAADALRELASQKVQKRLKK